MRRITFFIALILSLMTVTCLAEETSAQNINETVETNIAVGEWYYIGSDSNNGLYLPEQLFLFFLMAQ